MISRGDIVIPWDDIVIQRGDIVIPRHYIVIPRGDIAISQGVIVMTADYLEVHIWLQLAIICDYGPKRSILT
jgi:hypothetical protein